MLVWSPDSTVQGHLYRLWWIGVWLLVGNGDLHGYHREECGS
jgi:hypothetical protein